MLRDSRDADGKVCYFVLVFVCVCVRTCVILSFITVTQITLLKERSNVCAYTSHTSTRLYHHLFLLLLFRD